MVSGTPIERRSTGDNDSTIQTFWSNTPVDPLGQAVPPFGFNVPMFTTFGGTINYYGQDPQAVFTSQNSPFVRFEFTANTESFSGATEIVHDIYKLKFEDFSAYNPEFDKLGSTLNVDDDIIFEEEEIIENGVRTVRTTNKRIKKSATTEQFERVDIRTFEEIQTFLDTPYISITSGTSGFTSVIYDFFPGQTSKLPLSSTIIGGGDNTSEPFKRILFEDKGQYFLDTTFKFNQTDQNGYSEEQQLFIGGRDVASNISGVSESTFFGIEDGSILNYDVDYEQTTTYRTASPVSAISAGTFSGITVRGYYFTYFTVPNKPMFENPILSGTLETFSPQIFFSNVDDGDRYLVEVTYAINDTSFSGQTFRYDIDKILNEEGIQRAEIPLKTASDFRYRVGNIKALRNLFGVEQLVVSFSDSLTGRTQEEPAAIFVKSQTDSPYTGELPDFVIPPSITAENSGSYILSGTVIGSTVTGATVQLLIPGGGSLSAMTDTSGSYSFSGLQRGSYTVLVDYRGYRTNSEFIDINESRINNIDIEILWSNVFDTWDSKKDDLMGPK